MIAIIFSVIMVFMWIALVASYGVGAERNGEYTLGITLSEMYCKREEVQKVLAEYRKRKRLIHLIGFATIWLNILIQDYSSILIVFIFAWFFALMVAYTRVLKKSAWKLYELKKQQGWLVLTEKEREEGAEDDADLYWLEEKKDPNADRMQNKRVGFGFELNSSKKVDIIVIAVISVFVLGLAAFMLRFDLASVTMEVQNGIITIEAADMESKVSTDLIEEVIYMEKCPHMYKKHGYNGGKFNLGTFSVDTIGTCESYIYVHNDAGILITTKDEKILFNMETEEETKEIYEELKKVVPLK